MLGHFVLEDEFLVVGVEACTLFGHFCDGLLDVLELVGQLSVRIVQESEVLLLLVNLLLGDLDLSVELLRLLLRPFALGTGHVPVHLLNFVVSVVLEFLLTLRLYLKFVDGGLQVPGSRQGA